jgi:hypothetical protein
MSNPLAQVPASVVIGGGVDQSVVFKDGTSEAVKVKLVPFRQASNYLENVGDPAKLVEFVCGKPEGWSDNLTDDCVFEIDRIAREINDPRIDRWLERQAQVVETMKPKMARLSGQISS